VRRSYGFTLIEVFIATFILIVAILAALGLQATSLKNSAKARALREASATVDRAFQELRAANDLTSSCDRLDGSTAGQGTVQCTAVPCALSSGVLTCDSSVADPQLYDVSIEVRDGERVLMSAQSYVRPTLPLGGEDDE